MLTLASKSPARKNLLAATGLQFRVVGAHVDERATEREADRYGADPATIAEALATAKAQAVSDRHPEDLVIGADQILAVGKQRFAKPADIAAARARLDELRGKTHTLHSAVALARGGNRIWSTTVSADLTMRSFEDSERDTVLALEGDAVLGSVGAYRLEGPSIRLFERIEGDYFAILGLPLLPLLAALREYAPETLTGSPA